MRRSRGSAGKRRSDSTHMLTEVKWAGSRRSRRRMFGPRSSGSSATTMGNSRIALKRDRDGRLDRRGAGAERGNQDHLPRRRPHQQGRQCEPPGRQAVFMGECADTDIGAGEHQEEHRGPRRSHAAEEGGRIGIEVTGAGMETTTCLIAPPRAQPALHSWPTCALGGFRVGFYRTGQPAKNNPGQMPGVNSAVGSDLTAEAIGHSRTEQVEFLVDHHARGRRQRVATADIDIEVFDA